MDRDTITVVSGLPRSGTSMMMQMLNAGGLPVLADNLRAADDDNLNGYYEFEPVKHIERDAGWLPAAQGKAVKIVSPLVRHLPAEHQYQIVFMERDLGEVLASQRQMLIRRGQPVPADDGALAAAFRRHLTQVASWLATQPNMQVLHVRYQHVLEQPRQAVERLNRFFGNQLDAAAMMQVVDVTLRRQRRR